MKRPSIYDELTHKKFFESDKAKTLFKGFVTFEKFDTRLVEDFYDAFIYSKQDAYNMTKDLDNCGYDVNASVVELCDDYVSEIMNFNRKLVKEWVKSNNIQCPYKLDDVVEYKENGKVHKGIISNVNLKEGTVVLCCESEGHVRSGTGTQGYVVNYEEIVV